MTLVQPAITLNFAQAGGMFDPRVRCVRDSTATFFGQNGLLGTAFKNQPRIDYDPATGECLGLLVEAERANKALQSQSFDNATWSKSETSISADATAAPDGSATADKLVESTATSQHHITTQQIASAAPLTASIYVKEDERSRAILQVYGATQSGAIRVAFDLATGVTMGLVAAGTGTQLIDAGVAEISNGWYRAWVTGIPNTVDSQFMYRFYLTDPAGDFSDPVAERSYTGDGTSGMYLWGAQLEEGAPPTSYIPTTTAAVTREADDISVPTSTFALNALEGTLFADIDFGLSAATDGYFAALSDSSTNELIALQNLATTSAARFLVVGSSTTQADMNLGATPARARVAGAYKANDFAATVNAAAVTTDNAGSIPSGIATLSIGSRNGTALFLNDRIRRIAYYPRRLSDADLQTITS